MRISVVLIAALLLTLPLEAQNITGGAKAGLNIANWSTDFTNISSRLGFHLGAFAEYSLSDPLSLQGELLFSSVGATAENTLPDPDLRIVQNYIQIPIMADYEPFENFHAQGGLQFGFLVDAYDVEKNGPDEGDKDDEKDEFKTVEVAFLLGAEYDITEQITAGIRLALGLNNIAADEDDEINNIVFQIYAAAPLFGE